MTLFRSEMRFERLGCFTYSHEENTHAYLLEDDVPADVKQNRANEIMDIQAQISWELNQEKIGQTFRCIIDRKEGKDRKSTRLNSSHVRISYAVFCLKKKKTNKLHRHKNI